MCYLTSHVGPFDFKGRCIGTVEPVVLLAVIETEPVGVGV